MNILLFYGGQGGLLPTLREGIASRCPLKKRLIHPTSPFEPCTVKRAIQAGDHDAMPGTAGMDKLVIANINPDMVDIATAPMRRIKKDQVSRTQMAATDVFTIISLLA
jgi:hypothetical protein